MPLETGTYISSLQPSNPAQLDQTSQGDDHLRLIKSTIKNTFPNINGEVSATPAELNVISGTSVTNEEFGHLEGLEGNIQTQLDDLDTGISDTLTSLIPTLKLRSELTGIMTPFGGPVAPEDTVFCLGQELSRTEFSDLFSVIGTTWGAGDGSTTFNVPNMSERHPKGVGGSTQLGNYEEDSIRSHLHGSGTLVNSQAGSHNHNISGSWITGNRVAGGSQAPRLLQTGSRGTTSVGDHTHIISGETGSFGGAVTQPPSAGVNWIIFT